ncbi:MAG: type IV pilin N-terminal domain-containing protein [Euryarchaeota archaeon]|nr:type IV pilin N-terminal domain-containing protein [Euryarchaeota archaeon]
MSKPDLRRDNSDAVSEIIGAVLLLGLVIVGVAIIAVFIFSQPMPEEIPSIDLVISNVSTPSQEKIFVQHNGGDALAKADFTVYADGTPLDNDDATISGGNLDWPLSLGETLEFNVTSAPENVRVVYTGGESAAILKSAYQSVPDDVDTGGPDVVPTAIPTPDPGVDPEEYLEEHYVEHFLEQLESNSVYLSRAERGANTYAYMEGTLGLRINGSGSYVVVEDVPIVLYDDDLVEIVFEENQPNVLIYLVGDKGWSITVDTHVKVYINDIYVGNELTESWFVRYKSFTSTLNLAVGNDAQWTRLIINNVTILDEINSNYFVFYNITPAEPTLMTLIFPDTRAKGDRVQFVGLADRVTQNGDQIYP